MSDKYTLKQLTDVKDAAPAFGYNELQEARFATKDLNAEETGVSHHIVKPGKRQGFAHKHDEAEEVYVVIAGSGRMKLDAEIIEIGRLDAIRVAPDVTRTFEAGPDGLELLAVGARHDGDGEADPNWWVE